MSLERVSREGRRGCFYGSQYVRWQMEQGSDKKRPLGIPAIEDKLAQAGLTWLLTAIYEQDFVEDSYGFRPGRSCHDALRALSSEVEGQRTHYIVDADIKGFFDNVDHEWMMRFLEHRIADKRVLRYVKRFLKAGIMKDGVESDKETPQGGTVGVVLFVMPMILLCVFSMKTTQHAFAMNLISD